MLSLTRGRAVAALVLSLAALLAVTPALTAVAQPDTAVAAKKKCKKGSKKKGCKKAKKKAASKLPGPGTFLTSKNVRVSVSLRYPQKDLVVQVQIIGLTANCSEGGTHVVGGGVRIPMKGAHFSGRTDYPAGNFAKADGTFASATKATGTVQVGNVVVEGKGVCDTGEVSFTATKP